MREWLRFLEVALAIRPATLLVGYATVPGMGVIYCVVR